MNYRCNNIYICNKYLQQATVVQYIYKKKQKSKSISVHTTVNKFRRIFVITPRPIGGGVMHRWPAYVGLSVCHMPDTKSSTEVR